MRRPLITLTTDFGNRDHYVGAMKGVIKTIAPSAEIIDITHEIEPFAIVEAAFVFAQAYRYFPPRTVHVVVVDPGVGSSRRPILAEGGGYRFVAPDNGVLTLALEREGCVVREISSQKYQLQPVSQTFHGRDIFAPAAAHLARGLPPSRLGRKIRDALRLSLNPVQRIGKRVWGGTIWKVDRFGNLITSLPAAEFPQLRERPFELAVGLERVSLLASHYAQFEPGVLFVIEGSSGYLEVATNQESAAKRLGCAAGAPVELTIY